MRFVIIGNGAAGITAARALSQTLPDSEIRGMLIDLADYVVARVR